MVHLFHIFECRLNRVSADPAQHLIRHCLVNAQTTERNAPPQDMRCVAFVAKYSTSPTTVVHMQHSSASPTPKNASEQTSTTPACLRLHSGPHLGIGGAQRFVASIRFPGD